MKQNFLLTSAYIGAFLTENEALKDIYHQKIVETELTPELSVLLAARKFSVQWLHSWEKKRLIIF